MNQFGSYLDVVSSNLREEYLLGLADQLSSQKVPRNSNSISRTFSCLPIEVKIFICSKLNCEELFNLSVTSQELFRFVDTEISSRLLEMLYIQNVNYVNSSNLLYARYRVVCDVMNKNINLKKCHCLMAKVDALIEATKIRENTLRLNTFLEVAIKEKKGEWWVQILLDAGARMKKPTSEANDDFLNALVTLKSTRTFKLLRMSRKFPMLWKYVDIAVKKKQSNETIVYLLECLIKQTCNDECIKALLVALKNGSSS